MSERSKVDPIDEAAARAMHVDGDHPFDEERFAKRRWEDLPNIVRERHLYLARACRLAILRGMLKRELTDRIARAGAAEMWQCAVKENTVGLPDAQRIYRAMLSAEIDQLEKEST